MNSSFFKIVGLFLIFIVVVALTSFSLLKEFGTSGKNGLTKEDIEKVIAEYIQKNPQVILDSVTKHQQKSAMAEEQKSQIAVKDKLNEIENDPTSPVAGNPKGDVVVVEFFDYSCGYCKKVLSSIAKLVEEDRNIKIVFKEFPILGPNSDLASRAALSVNMIAPEKYFELHKKLMSSHVSGQESIDSIVKELGIDVKEMQNKMKSPEVEKIIAKNRELASTIAIHGTPAFIIGGELVPGAVDYDTFKQLVAKARGKK